MCTSKFRQIYVIFSLLFLMHVISALNLEKSKEQACFPIKRTVDVDLKWMMSVKSWYYPLMSRFDLYLGSLELFGNLKDPEKLSESRMYYESCIKGEIGESGIIVSGFNGKRVSWVFGPPAITDDGLKYQDLTLNSGYKGIAYTTLTDNSTYSFLVVCWEDNQMSWGVTSTHAPLSEETVKVIHDHAEWLGFRKEYFEELRYDHCVNEHVNTISAHRRETCDEIPK